MNLVGRLGFAQSDVRERARVIAQQFELMLREVADGAVLPAHDVASQRRKVAGERSHQRRLAGAVGAEYADSSAGRHSQRSGLETALPS